MRLDRKEKVENRSRYLVGMQGEYYSMLILCMKINTKVIGVREPI